jgi:hypothetical protein
MLDLAATYQRAADQITPRPAPSPAGHTRYFANARALEWSI